MTFDRLFSSRETLLERRQFIAGLVAWTAGIADSTWAEVGTGPLFGSCSDCPMQCLLERKMPTLVAFVDVQLHCLWCGCPNESAREVACEVLRFVSYLPRAAQEAVCLTLTSIDFHSFKYAKRWFRRLSIPERLQLLNQGEYPGGAKLKYPLVTWDNDFSFHTAVGSLALLVRLVTNSRMPARRLIGFRWSAQCMNPDNLVHMPAPPYPDLSATYDVCVIGSGAGGSVVAARAAEAGLSVLIVEEGEWISPDGLVQRTRDEHGREIVWPARDDEGLIHLFQGCGLNLAGRLSDPEVDQRSIEEYLSDEGVPGLTLYGKLRKSRPRQAINVLQARVVGGGPYINNAIHLEIEESVWERWPCRPPQASYADLRARMQQIKQDLGVNCEASRRFSGDRTRAFVDACGKAAVEADPLPVSILVPTSDEDCSRSCSVCGSDNIVDPFGQHIGGLHPFREGQPNSYFMRALAAGALIAYEMRAWRLDIRNNDGSEFHADGLVAEDRRGLTPHQHGPAVRIRARAYVLAAGAVASTVILSRTAGSPSLAIRGLGCNFTANVVTPVYAVFDKPICNGGNVPEPGIAQCFYVRRVPADGNGQEEPSLENWFHYPGSLAIALTGWFCEYASMMRRYDHISICGMVVPTKPRPENRIDHDGRVRLTIDQDEFELLLSGIRKIGRIYLAAATADNGVTLHLPTKGLLLDSCGHPVRIRDLSCLDWALQQIRCRGPEFLNLATAHPQGGNALGSVVDPLTFRVQDNCQRVVRNLYVADASVFPAGCDVNPQLTIHALATYAADSLIGELMKSSHDRQARYGY
jgi:choline dehydrogenase-like flavoprotein